MESRFHHSFAGVRLHDDAQAAASARAVNALAYNVGDHLVFGANRYAPRSSEGRDLLAHELAHVTQHAGGLAAASPSLPSLAEDRVLEADADRRAGLALSAGGHDADPVRHTPGAIHRQAAPVSPGVGDHSPPGGELPASEPADASERIIRLAESKKDADRQAALDLILTTYYPRPENFGGVHYDPNYSHDGPGGKPHSDAPQQTDTTQVDGQDDPFGGVQQIVVGPRFFKAFRERFVQRVRSIGHELQHVGQRSPPGRSGAGSRFAGAGVGLAAGGLLGLAGVGIAFGQGHHLSGGLIAGVIGGAAALGGLIGAAADPFGSKGPIRDKNTREFLAIHWVLTADVRNLGKLPRDQALRNIEDPKEGALVRYAHMPSEDQRRYQRQYTEILTLQRQLRYVDDVQTIRKLQPNPVYQA
jgi:hypothetical protein